MGTRARPGQPPANGSWLVTLAASAGGIGALQTLLAAVPRDLPAAVVVVQHRALTRSPDQLSRILGRFSRLPVVSAAEDQIIEPGHVYVARPDLHLTVSSEKRFSYVNGHRIRFVLSSANPLFESAAAVFGDHLVAVVLTGSGSDATDGIQSVKAQGGLVIAQDPTTAQFGGMPEAAVRSGAVDLILPLEDIGPALDAIVRGRPIPGIAPIV